MEPNRKNPATPKASHPDRDFWSRSATSRTVMLRLPRARLNWQGSATNVRLKRTIDVRRRRQTRANSGCSSQRRTPRLIAVSRNCGPRRSKRWWRVRSSCSGPFSASSTRPGGRRGCLWRYVRLRSSRRLRLWTTLSGFEDHGPRPRRRCPPGRRGGVLMRAALTSSCAAGPARQGWPPTRVIAGTVDDHRDRCGFSRSGTCR
jgi:hypothetical protein